MRYDFSCTNCGTIQEIVLPLSRYEDYLIVFCCKCKYISPHAITITSPPAVEDWGKGGSGRHFEDLTPTGMTFSDKASYKRHLKENGIVEWTPKRGMPGCDP